MLDTYVPSTSFCVLQFFKFEKVVWSKTHFCVSQQHNVLQSVITVRQSEVVTYKSLFRCDAITWNEEGRVANFYLLNTPRTGALMKYTRRNATGDRKFLIKRAEVMPWSILLLRSLRSPSGNNFVWESQKLDPQTPQRSFFSLKWIIH